MRGVQGRYPSGVAASAASITPDSSLLRAVILASAQPLGGSGGVWQRLVSFLAGAGLGGALGYASLLHDVEHSTQRLEAALGGLRGEAGALHRETRERIAVLEHEVAQLKRGAGDGGRGGGGGGAGAAAGGAGARHGE